MTTTLTISLIVRNEEKSLGGCLESVAGLGGEIVVVDTGSIDRTREVAAAHGARVFDFPWGDDFAAARNESLRLATGDWVLWLDADEYFDDANRGKVKDLLAEIKTSEVKTSEVLKTSEVWGQAYVMVQRSHHAAGQTGSRVQQVRLFPRHPEVRWEYRVHEQLLPSLRRAGFGVRFTDIVIEHTGYVDPALRDRKMERNLRLLHLDQAERPDDPFTLFNLGLGYSQLGRLAEAIPMLRRSLERSRPGDSIVSKLYAALVRAHDRLGQRGEALAACRAGRVRCPEDAELLFLDGLLRQAGGDLAGAEACWRRVLNAGSALSAESAEREAQGASRSLRSALPSLPGYFCDVDEGMLTGAREQLGMLCRAQGRDAEAEEHWLALLGAGNNGGPECPPHEIRALLGLGEVYLAQKRYADLERAAGRLGAIDGPVLLARAQLARREFAEARSLLESALAKAPQAVPPRVFLTHVLLQEGRDLAAAEKALRAVLVLDPGQAESWRNLAVLLRSQNRLAEALAVCASARAHGAVAPELALMHGMLLHEAGDLVNAEAILLEVLEREASIPGRTDIPVRPGSVSMTARHNLAMIYRRQGRLAEAEGQWRAVVAEMPDLSAAWHGLAELFLEQGRIAEGEAILHRRGTKANTALFES